MANEISCNVILNVANGAYEDRFSSGNVRSDQATQAGAAGVVTIGTAVQTLSIVPVTSAGYAAFRNLNTQTSGTHYISLGAYVGTNLHEFARLERNAAAVVPLAPSITIGLSSTTSTQYTQAARLQYLVLSR
jgi:hypothetical protein